MGDFGFEFDENSVEEITLMLRDVIFRVSKMLFAGPHENRKSQRFRQIPPV